jgi:hypothetical protein
VAFSSRVVGRLSGLEAVAECSEGPSEGLLRDWAALRASASFERSLDEVEKCLSFLSFPLGQVSCLRSSAPRVKSGSRVLADSLVMGLIVAEALSRSWRSLDEEVRTASSSSFFLLTAQESPEQRVKSGERF